MNRMTSLFSRLFLALTLATGAGAAMAVPTSYHIDLDTRSFTGDGYLDLTFNGNGAAGAATAITSNFMGDASGASMLDGSVTGDLATSAVFDNAGLSDLAQLIHFGGVFAFDVLFDFADVGEGTIFGITLYNANFSAYVGADGPLASIALVPGAGSFVSVMGPFATVTEISAVPVPEPGQWLLMVTGLLMLGAMSRRRSR